MKLYRTNKGFIVKSDADTDTMIGYDDYGLSYGRVDQKDRDSAVFVTSLDGQFGYPNYPMFNNGKLSYNFHNADPLQFWYDADSRDLVCEYANKTHRVKLITDKQIWMDKYPGPYSLLCIRGIKTYVNPLKELDYVFHNGMFIETFPIC